MRAKKQDDLDQLLTDVGGLLKEVAGEVRAAVNDAGKAAKDAGAKASNAIKRANVAVGLWQVCPVCKGKALPSKKRCVTCDGTRIISVLSGKPPKG